MTFKPCPFCGEAFIQPRYDYIEQIIGGAIDLYMWAECSRCGARSARKIIDTCVPGRGFSKSEKERKNLKICYDLWNRRVNK